MKKEPFKPNEKWHLKNRYPKNPTEQQRVHWLIEHAEHCGCNAYPGNGKRAKKEGFDFEDFLEWVLWD